MNTVAGVTNAALAHLTVMLWLARGNLVRCADRFCAAKMDAHYSQYHMRGRLGVFDKCRSCYRAV